MAGGSLTFRWRGPANSFAVLATGPRNPGSFDFGCGGKLDLGFPPFTDVAILATDLLDSSGRLQQVEAVPAGLPTGFTFHVQGAVLQPGACPFVMTAAAYGTVQ